MRATLEERFLSKVLCDVASRCWLWQAAKDGRGYGKIQTGTLAAPRYEQAHRVAFRLAHGRAPAGSLMHACDVRSCVSPEHLSEGTAQENHDDMWAKGRGSWGEQRSNAKVTFEQVLKIRAACAAGATLTSQAREYGIAVPTVWKIVHRQSWNRG